MGSGTIANVEPFQRQLDLPAAPWVVGHRGAAGEAAENSLASLLLAVEQRADMVELDLQLTRDGALVAFHDWELDRLTGRSGVVEEMTRDQLRSARVAGPVAGEPGEPLADLVELLERLPGELPINLELKRRAADPDAVVEALAGALEERPRVLVSSFDWPLLALVRRRLPDLLVATLGRDDADGLLDAAEALDALSVHCHRRLATAPFVARATARGRPVLVYTVNDPRAARILFDRGAAGVFTDFPGRLRASWGASAGGPSESRP